MIRIFLAKIRPCLGVLFASTKRKEKKNVRRHASLNELYYNQAKHLGLGL
jgi:hypothetical protein